MKAKEIRKLQILASREEWGKMMVAAVVLFMDETYSRVAPLLRKGYNTAIPNKISSPEPWITVGGDLVDLFERMIEFADIDPERSAE